MTVLTKSSSLDIDLNSIAYLPQVSGEIFAGEDLYAATPCRVGSGGTVLMSDADGADAGANVVGWTPKAYNSGEAVTLIVGPGMRIRYSSGLTPGDLIYLGETAGTLDDATTTGDDVGIAYVVSATDIVTLGPKAVA